MSEKINTKQLISDIDIVDVISKHITLKKKGVEMVGMCPFHDDTKASLSVNRTKQIYKCFACGAGGDVIDYLMRPGHIGLSFKDAIEAVTDRKFDELTAETHTHSDNRIVKTNQWQQVKEPPNLPKEIIHYRHGVPSMLWEYRNADGTIQGYVARFDTPDGKEVLPFVFATNEKTSEWRWQGFDAPRPLYQLHRIVGEPDKTIMVVEGEKTAEAAQKLLPHIIVTTWVGGANGIAKTDFSPLNGRKNILWPDNDHTHKYPKGHKFAGDLKPLQEQPGNKVMIEIAALIKDPAALKYVKNPEGFPCGWDVADATDWTPESTREFVRANITDQPPLSPGVIAEVTDEVKSPPPLPEELNHDKKNPHFKFLGWDKSESNGQRFNFFSHGSKAVLSMAATSLTKPANLMQIAPLNWWEQEFPSRSKTGFDIDGAVQWIIGKSNIVGPFRARSVRGRGAWMDDKRIVIHNGEKLIVDGQTIQLGNATSRFIYEMSEPLGFNTDKQPLTTKDANGLMEIMKWLNWERDVNAYLLAGWCVIAPFCGVFKWRPHIWLTGSAGTGKTWVFKNIVQVFLGETALGVQGETTEPGLRQLLGHDALPVVFDEAEGEDKRAQERMQQVLGLMRASSADDGGIIAKGTAGGNGSKTYRIRSCFAFASIGVQVQQQADRTRVTILALKALRKDDPIKTNRWKELQAAYNEIVAGDFVERLQARTISLLPVIVDNTRTFANAAAAELSEQRLGDQLGAMLAGAYSLFRADRISYEDAVKWIREKNWNEERSLDGSRDELNLLAYIADHVVQVETEFTRYERSINELIQLASKRTVDPLITADIANSKLKRCGLKVNDLGDAVCISNSHKYLLQMLSNTIWSKNHNKILMRIENARAVEIVRFAGLSQGTRAVSIPISVFADGEARHTPTRVETVQYKLQADQNEADPF